MEKIPSHNQKKETADPVAEFGPKNPGQIKALRKALGDVLGPLVLSGAIAGGALYAGQEKDETVDKVESNHSYTAAANTENARATEIPETPESISLPNQQNDELNKAISERSEDDLIEGIRMSSCLEQGGSLSECLNKFSLQIKDFSDKVSNEHAEKVADRVLEAKMNPDFFEVEHNKIKGLLSVPEISQKVLLGLLPGWIDHESAGREDALSSAGAKGYAQFKSATYGDHMKSSEVSEDINDHLDAMGSLAASNYHHIFSGTEGEKALSVLEEQFDSQVDFAKKLIPKIMVGAHITGGGDAKKWIVDFIKSVPAEEMARGEGLYSQMIDHGFSNGNLSQEAAEYVAWVFAKNEALIKRFEELGENNILASLRGEDNIKDKG